MQRVPYPQTPESARKWLVARGIALSALARAHGIARWTLDDVLRGRLRGHRGQAHAAAVLLGLKQEADTQ